MDKNKLVSEKISLLKKEGYPQNQAVAISISMYKSGRLRSGGVYVKSRKRTKPKKSGKAKKSRKPKKKSRKARRKSRSLTGARKSRGPKKGKSRKPKKKSRKRTRFKMQELPIPILKKEPKLYRSTGYEKSSCNHPFFGPSIESVKSYIKLEQEKTKSEEATYVITTRTNGKRFKLLNLDQNILSIFSKDPAFKKFFFPQKKEDAMKRVFIKKKDKWERASDDKKLDCEFYNKLFKLYPDAQGFYTKLGNTPAECVLNEKMKPYLREVEKTYIGMRKPRPRRRVKVFDQKN